MFSKTCRDVSSRRRNACRCRLDVLARHAEHRRMQPSSQVSNKVTPARRLELRALAVPAGSDVDFGVECSPGRASLLSDADFAKLEHAVLTLTSS